MGNKFEYPFEMRPLSPEEGGGWLITFPDLPGCISDGETLEEVIANGRGATAAWIGAMQAVGKDIPAPGEAPSGKFIAQVPRSIHLRLSACTKQEGVSMNALVSAFLTESLRRREAANETQQGAPQRQVSSSVRRC